MTDPVYSDIILSSKCLKKKQKTKKTIMSVSKSAKFTIILKKITFENT